MAYGSLTCNVCGYKAHVHLSVDFDLLDAQKQKEVWEEMQKNEICPDCKREAREQEESNDE